MKYLKTDYLVVGATIIIGIATLASAKTCKAEGVQKQIVVSNSIQPTEEERPQIEKSDKTESQQISKQEDNVVQMKALEEKIKTLNKERQEEVKKEEQIIKTTQKTKSGALSNNEVFKYISTGSVSTNPTIYNYVNEFNYYANMFGVDPALLQAIVAQESGGDYTCTGAAKGIAQIEDTCISDFIQFGREYFGQEWIADDRYDINCAIAYLSHKISVLLDHYNGDYQKAIQAYNFSHFSLDKLIDVYGEDWMNHRDEIAYVNGYYDRTGSIKYGDPKYIEHVMRYYARS